MTKMKRIGKYLAGVVVALAAVAAHAGTVTYYHNDLAGSPVVATNEAGQVIWRESYRPYGERTVKSAASSGNKVWFTSRHQDADTGLVYMGARYYDPLTGRFVSTDPVGFDEQNLHSFNRYAYANNNPYKYVDPDGRSPVHALRAVGQISFAVATRFGARELGSAIGGGLWVLLNEGSDSEKGANPGAGSNQDEGCIYCVKGDKTKSGKDYVGSTDNLEDRQRDKSDGRDREGAEVVDRYPKGDRDVRRAKEQQAINDRGGVDNLDNRRNEIAPRKWPDYGVKPPQ